MGSRTPRGSPASHPIDACDGAFGRSESLGTPDPRLFGAPSPHPSAPLPTLRLPPHGNRRTARGETRFGYSFVPGDFHPLSSARSPGTRYGRNAQYCAPSAQIRTWTFIHPAPTSCPPENAPFGWSAGAIAGWDPPSVPRPLGFRGDFCRWAAASGLVPPRIRRPGRAAPFPPPAGFADGVEGSRRQAARLRRRWARARACRCSSSPIRWTLKAVTDRATLRANPSAPYDRTRSLPRGSRLWIADSTAGCCRRIFRNVGSASRFRSA